MRAFTSSRRAVSLTGYALIVGLIAAVAIVAVGRVGGSMGGLLGNVGNRLAVTSNTGGPGGGGGTPAPVNQAPQFGGTVGDLTVQSAVAMTAVDITGFSDPNGDTISFSPLGSWPAGISLVKQSNSTVRIQGTPATPGAYTALSIRASDGSLTVDTPAFIIVIDPCAGTPAAGASCNDGSVAAGITPDSSVPFFATRCDAGMSWNGSSCTGSRTKFAFNDGSSNWVDTALGNCYNPSPTADCHTGKANSLYLYNTDSSTAGGFQYHLAAKYCEELVENGKSDWYLPSSPELNGIMYPNRAAIGNFATSGALSDRYHTSTEYSNTTDINPDMNNGDLLTGTLNKASGLNVRCVRR